MHRKNLTTAVIAGLAEYTGVECRGMAVVRRGDDKELFYYPYFKVDGEFIGTITLNNETRHFQSAREPKRIGVRICFTLQEYLFGNILNEYVGVEASLLDGVSENSNKPPYTELQGRWG